MIARLPVAAAAAALVLLATRIGYVPLWDGRIYADCIVDAAAGRLALSTLRCADHISHAYMLYAGAIQWLRPGSFPAILLANALLYLLACIAFVRLTRLAFPDDAHRVGRAFLGAAFALQPSILASVVQPTIDLPLLPGFLWGALFVLRRQWVRLVTVGVAMVFSKETGVIFYAALVGVYALLSLISHRRSASEIRRVLVHLVPLAIPLVVFAIYLAYRATLPKTGTLVWAAGTSEMSLLKRFVLPRFDRPLLSFLVMLFVLNFSWIPSAIIGVDAAVGLRRLAARIPARPLAGADASAVKYLVVLCTAVLYIVTRFTMYTNTRYALIAFALLPLAMYASMVRLRLPRPARDSLAAALAVVFAASTIVTADPVSRAVYGTFSLGDRSLLRMTRFTNECCGAGRDQLVYNLQFTKFADLTSDATAFAHADASTAVFVPKNMLWGALGPVDARTGRRTLERSHAVLPRLLEPDSLAATPVPTRAVLLAIPNGDVPGALRALSSYYLIGRPQRFSRGAYWLELYSLTPRPAATL
jgi:hypothetical protein